MKTIKADFADLKSERVGALPASFLTSMAGPAVA